MLEKFSRVPSQTRVLKQEPAASTLTVVSCSPIPGVSFQGSKRERSGRSPPSPVVTPLDGSAKDVVMRVQYPLEGLETPLFSCYNMHSAEDYMRTYEVPVFALEEGESSVDIPGGGTGDPLTSAPAIVLTPPIGS